MLLGRHQLTRHDSARRLVRDSVTSSSEYPGLLQKLPIHSSTPIRHRQPASATRQARRQQALSDDHSEVEPLLPIPNRNVKRFCADDSGPAPVKVGHRQTPIHQKARTLYGLFFRLYISYRLCSYVSFGLFGLLQPLRILCELFVSCYMSPAPSLFVSCYTSPVSSFLDSEALP